MLSNTRWKTREFDESNVAKLAEETNRSKTFVRLCLSRGLDTKAAIENFTEPTAEWFHDPFLLFDMEKSVERIQQAIAENELITVYGDYDADGVTSTVIMLEAIEMSGGRVNYFIPNRFKEGYGPNVEAFKQMINEGTQLIITVDNGIAGHEAIEKAQNLGVDVIVTDHHECPAELPKAFSIVHPKHPDGQYPFKDLAGAGVSLKVAQALLGEMPQELIELAMIGTVADLVSLTDENRALVYFGLKLIRQTDRLGLLALLMKSSLKPEDIDEEAIGFKLSPPINAVGRLGDASMVVELLKTFDENEAEKLSEIVLQKNEERKELVESITSQAMAELTNYNGDKVVVMKNPDWHEGVLGIVASRIAEKVSKPTLILTENLEENKIKGSGRSIPGFNLYDCVNQTKELLSSFGGHEMACGLSLKSSDFDTFRQEINLSAERLAGEETIVKELDIDSTAEGEELSVKLVEEIALLRPFGQDNKKPVFKLSDMKTVQSRVIGANQNHFKAVLAKAGKEIDMIAFNASDWNPIFTCQPQLDVAGYLDINEWNGNRKVQLQGIDFKTNTPVIIDKRKSGLNSAVFQQENAHYLFFSEKNYKKWEAAIIEGATSQLYSKDSSIDPVMDGKTIYIIDIPDETTDFFNVIEEFKNQEIYLFLYAPHDYYFKGMPKRETFTRLYKWLLKKQEINLKKDTREIISLLKVDKEIVKFMLMVFLENEFVTIEDGKLSVVENPGKKSLEHTKTYKRRLNQIEVEEKLVYSSFNELLAALKNKTSDSVIHNGGL